MHEGTVTITASLWRKILLDRAIKHTFWKYLKTYTITLIVAIAGVVTVYLSNKDKSLLELIFWFCGFWFVLQIMTMTQIYLTIRSIKEDYSFHINLNEVGIKILEERIPWEHYEFYIENDHYLEIHNKNQQISYLPKSNDIKELVDYTKAYIQKKDKQSI